ncbi:HEAT repeat domain-containing protein [Algoriphagus namhaensis]
MNNRKSFFAFSLLLVLAFACMEKKSAYAPKEKSLSQSEVQQMAQEISAQVNPSLHEDFELELWAVDSLMYDAISIQALDNGDVIYTHTNRQKNSEFDIRGHQDWEIRSIALQSVEDKRKFLREELSPERSQFNTWLADLNGDGSHDWRDMTVQKEEIFRLSDRDGDGMADFSQRLVEDFHDEVTDVAGALMMTEEALFVGAGPDLWKLIDSNGDGIMDEKESLSHGYAIHIGFGAHGMSGLEMGPDGRVYWGIGDIGFNGTGPDGTEWKYPNRGVIARANPDGSDFEIFAMGIRNTHEFVFDQYNNLISVDNDGDHPGEKERLVYLTNGSDSGWRTNWQFGKYRDENNNTYKVWMDEKLYLPRWEGQAAFITPCIANYVSGPTGMVYNPGTAFSEKYRDTFFVVEFVGNPTNSAIHGFKLAPNGASFQLASTEKIISGVLPTGMDFGPGGELYFADWITGWGTKDYGRMWKLRTKSKSFAALQEETKQLLNTDFGKEDISDLEPLLAHADMRVRRKSQFELAKRGNKGAEVFKNTLQNSTNQLARIHALVGLSQLARMEDESYAEGMLPYLKDEDAEIRAQAAKWLGDIKYKPAGEALLTGLTDENARVQFFSAEALGRIAYSKATEPLLLLLEENDDKDAYLRHAATLALARIGDEERLAKLSNHPSPAVRLGAVIALRRLESPQLRNFLIDDSEFIVTEAARAIHDDFSVEEALPDLAALLNVTPFSNEPLMRRIISANQRIGKEKEFDQTLTYIQTVKSSLKVEAIDAIGTWAKPSEVDRVDGRYRGAITRDMSFLGEKTLQTLLAQLKDSEEGVRLASAKALGKLKVANADQALLARILKDPSFEVRIQSLSALQALQSPLLGDAIQQSLASEAYPLRVAGLSLLGETDLPKDQKVALLRDVILNQTNAERQSALLALGQLEDSSEFDVWEEILGEFENGKLSQAVWVELEEAIQNTGSDQLKSEFQAILQKQSEGEPWKMYAGALAEGNARVGRSIFLENQTAQCIRCHAYDDMGGNAGPKLEGIAKKLSREELLIALVEPSARIAPGFGQVSISLHSGDKISGTFISEDDTGISYLDENKAEQFIAKKDVESRKISMSSMPPMGTLLSKRELRDLVSYLSTLHSESD